MSRGVRVGDRPEVLENLLSLPGLLSLALLILSFHVHGVSAVTIGGFNTTAWDWATLLVALRCFLYASTRGVRVGSKLKLLLPLMVFFQLWMGVSAFVSPDPLRALTMIFLQLRNFVLVISIATLFDFKNGLPALNKVVFLMGVLVSVVSVGFYIPVLLDVARIAASSDLWKPGTIYVLDQGGVLRLIGFAGDPNFLSLWLSLSLTTGLSVRPSKWRNLGLVVITIALTFALSRGFVVSAMLSLLVMTLGAAVRPSSRAAIQRYLRPVGVLAIGVLVLVIMEIVFGGVLWRQILTRIQLAGATPRFAMWSRLLEVDFNPLVGLGLRGAQDVLAGKYSHNTYLDIVFETGVFGVAIWTIILAFVTVLGLRHMSDINLLPWLHTWVITLGMFMSLSLAYNPFPWLLTAVMVGYVDQTQSKHKISLAGTHPPRVKHHREEEYA